MTKAQPGDAEKLPTEYYYIDEDEEAKTYLPQQDDTQVPLKNSLCRNHCIRIVQPSSSNNEISSALETG